MSNFLRLKNVSAPRPETVNSAEAIVEFLKPKAVRILQEDGECEPTLFLVQKDAINFLDVTSFFTDDTDFRDMFRDFVVAVCDELDLEGLGLVTEGWMVTRSKLPDKPLQPYEEPDRKEVLFIYGEWRDGTTYDLMIPFGRDEQNRPVLETPKEATHAQGGGRLRKFFRSVPRNQVPKNETVH